MDTNYNFGIKLKQSNIDLNPTTIDTLQVNITKLCNQACHHCHVDSSPKRTEQMDIKTVDRCLEILEQNPEITNLDLTGGAPELNPHFDYMVEKAVELGKHVMVRHNLTVTIDGHPVTGESKRYLPEFYKKHKVEVISSLPYYQEYFTDKQRGRGVFKKSLDAIKLLNEQGFGHDGSGLELNFVYNPIGAYLPPEQKSIEADYKRELLKNHGIVFNSLYVITNMPIHRFKDMLIRMDGYHDYMEKLVNAYNPTAVDGVMCRSMLSVSYDGRVYDCDFNQMLDLQLRNGKLMTVFNLDMDWMKKREIIVGAHCFGCTAGAGSSCGGATA